MGKTTGSADAAKRAVRNSSPSEKNFLWVCSRRVLMSRLPDRAPRPVEIPMRLSKIMGQPRIVIARWSVPNNMLACQLYLLRVQSMKRDLYFRFKMIELAIFEERKNLFRLLSRIIHATRKSNNRVSIEAEPCRREGISAKGFIVMLGARQTV
jgi:hypothetical protein